MPEIIGVKFRSGGKVYYFSPGDLEIHYHDHVIVETARGLDYGTVVLPVTQMEEDKVTAPLKPVIRKATKDDEATQAENLEKEKTAYKICKEKIAEHNLEMKLIQVEYTFDNSKILFYFTADGRIDFRELVKDLASIFKTRIELRQIGVRDETKLLGGMGICGRPLCCHSWLTDFQPVSIKMAKDQNLSLNPAKISGVCGRLMCCLKNEADTYVYLNKGMPGKGDYVMTKDGMHGEVQSVNILRRSVKVILDLENGEKDLQEFNVDDITFIPKGKRGKCQCQCPGKAQMEALANAAAEGEAQGTEEITVTEEISVTEEVSVTVADDDALAKAEEAANVTPEGAVNEKRRESGTRSGRGPRDRSQRSPRQGRKSQGEEKNRAEGAHPEKSERMSRQSRHGKNEKAEVRYEGRPDEERRGDESRAKDRRERDRARNQNQGDKPVEGGTEPAKRRRRRRPRKKPAQAAPEGSESS